MMKKHFLIQTTGLLRKVTVTGCCVYRDRERKLISKIDKALDRVEDGTFGICEECGEEITEGRLKGKAGNNILYCL